MKVKAAAWLLFCVVPGTGALAHPGDDALSTWYRSLKGPGGVSCCSEQDCHPVQAKLVGDEWQVLGEHGWETVPTEALLHRENIDGRPIVCRIWRRIECFVPPPES